MTRRARCRSINRPICLELSVGRLINLSPGLCGGSGALELAELFFVVGTRAATASMAVCRAAMSAARPLSVFALAACRPVVVDDGADRGVAVEGGPPDAGLLGDGGECDGLPVCCELVACLLGAAEVARAVHPAWALLMRSSRRAMSLRCRSASLVHPRSCASLASCSVSGTAWPGRPGARWSPRRARALHEGKRRTRRSPLPRARTGGPASPAARHRLTGGAPAPGAGPASTTRCGARLPAGRR
jgi:hypothetical protein